MKTRKRARHVPYARSGNVLIDSLLFTARVMGASAIAQDRGVITCVYEGRTITAEYTHYEVLAGHDRFVRTCTDLIDLLLAPQAAHTPGERRRDPAAEAAQESAQEVRAAA